MYFGYDTWWKRQSFVERLYSKFLNIFYKICLNFQIFSLLFSTPISPNLYLLAGKISSLLDLSNMENSSKLVMAISEFLSKSMDLLFFSVFLILALFIKSNS